MDYHFNNKAQIEEFNIYHNPKLQKQIINNNNNLDFFRNNSILKEKMMSKKYRTAKNSAKKLKEDSSNYINEKSNELFANRIKKIYSKKSNNINFRENSGNLLLNRNYNKYFMNNSALGNNNINMSNIGLNNLSNNNLNNISNSNFAYNNNLLNYYNNNYLEVNDLLNNNSTNKIFMKKINHKNYNEEFENLEQDNSYNNINNYLNNNGMDFTNHINNNIIKKKYINAYKKNSENKLVKNYLNLNNLKKANEKMLIKNKIFNSHQRIKSNEDTQNKIKKIYNLKYKKEMPKYALKYSSNNNINNISNNNPNGISFINKKINNYLNYSDINALGLSTDLSKINYNNLNKTNRINFSNNINMENNNENQINNLINSIEGYMGIKNEIKKSNIYNNESQKSDKNLINQKINNIRFYSSKNKNFENNNYKKVMEQNKSENKKRIKRILNPNPRKKAKEISEISNEKIGGGSSIKTTYFSSFNNNINNNNSINLNNNINKIYSNENSLSISKTKNNFNTIMVDKKNSSENNFNNFVIKEYATKDKEKIKGNYSSTNNSFTNKIYQKKISSQKEYLTSNNSLQNIKLHSIKKNILDTNKLYTNNSNINIISDNNSKIKPEEINPKLELNDEVLNKKENEEEKNRENILKLEENINKNDNNKKRPEINSSYKTNEFETKNLSEFPVNENIIIKNNVEEYNNIYMNNNDITILNEKNKEENKKEENKDNNLVDFKSIQSSDTLVNKDKNITQLNSNIVKKEEIKEKEKMVENKKIELELNLDINTNNKKNEKEILNEMQEKKKDNNITNDNINQNIINKEITDKEIKIEEKKEEKKIEEKLEEKKENKINEIDLNFLKSNILGEIKDESNNIINEKKLEIEQIEIKEDSNKIIIKDEKQKNLEDDKNKIKENKIKENKEKENKEKNSEINIINEDLIVESPLDSSKTKNKRELHKHNEKILNLLKQDMLCIPSQAKNIKSSLLSNLFQSTFTKDCNFYQKYQQKLSSEIKEYYRQNKSYPNSNINYYLYGRQIGHGAFGQVNLALHIASGRLVAIKIFAKKNLKNTRAKEKIMTEIETLSNFHHPFINQILDNFETETHIFIVMEYVCGDLLGFIRKRAKLSESVSKIIFKQLIEGLKYIHKKHYVHRDIKLDNILIDLTNTIKICDFGVSKHFEDKNEIMFDHCGTPAYIAPEIFEHTGYKGPACDIWSAGVTLYYMLAGEQPFKAGSISELEKIIKAGQFKEIEGVSKEANNLLSKILQVNPKARLSLDEILNHKWLDKVDLSQRHKLNLFTEAEKILMSKFDVNYLNSDKSELIESFTLKNIEDNPNGIKIYGNTKSIIFAPYNTFIDEFETDKDNNNNKSNNKTPIKKKKIIFEEEKFYKEIQIQNDICKFGIKAQQLNIQYELSNNGDFDNGLIKTEKQEDFLKENEKIEKMFETKKGKKWKNKDKYDDECEIINVRKDILEKIEKEVGYKSDYIIKCIKKNIINYATATYFLLEKDEQFN